MSFHYTDEKIPKRHMQGGKTSRSVFDESGSENSRWKFITQEELLTGVRQKKPDEQEPFASLIRMIQEYQVTEEGRRNAFLEQAKWMESYEEEGDIQETVFYHQYVGYQEMDVRELHAYFSWRTRFRRGESVPFCLEFMRLHAAELINRIGVRSWKEAFDRLLKLQAEVLCLQPDRLPGGSRRLTESAYYSAAAGIRGLDRQSEDRGKLRMVLSGFVIAWAAEEAVPDRELLQEYCVSNPEREEENITLLHYENSNDAAIYRMICRLVPGWVRSTAFLKEAGEDVWRVTARVFRSVCRIQKKAGTPPLAERLLGKRRNLQRDLFPMIPYQTRASDGARVEITPATSYTYQDGQWYRSDYPLLRDEKALRELHGLVRECERILRRKLHYKSQLTDQMKNPVLAKMISDEFDRWQTEKELRNRPEIHVDLSRLGAIRSLAAITRERLLEGTDEGAEADALSEMMNDPAAEELSSEGETAASFAGETAASSVEVTTAPSAGSAAADSSGAGSIFSAKEAAFLQELLDGGSGADFFRDHKILPSVFVDAINEKAFDEIGDSIVEEDGAGWQLVEDYIGDVRELLAWGVT